MKRGSLADCGKPHEQFAFWLSIGQPLVPGGRSASWSVAGLSNRNFAGNSCGLTWFHALKNSARNSRRYLSPIGKFLKIDKSQFWNPGPRMMLRPESPKEPSTVFVAKAHVLKNVPGIQGLALGSPMRFGRAALATFPPPSEFDRFVVTSVGVK